MLHPADMYFRDFELINTKPRNPAHQFKEIPAVHVHKDSDAREVAKHHYWYKYRSQLFLEGFRGRRKYRHVRKELMHSICMILSGKMVYTLLI